VPSSANTFSYIARAIQLALTPAFLLTGIAGMLNGMAGRLSRIIDRGRALAEGRVPSAHDSLVLEIQILERRRHFTSVAITAATIAALLVCIVIAALFIEVMLGAPLNWLIGSLFTAAMAALVVGLAFFLREVHLAMRSTRIPIPRAE
jgi:Protein of unknown function (DUF2721)